MKYASMHQMHAEWPPGHASPIVFSDYCLSFLVPVISVILKEYQSHIRHWRHDWLVDYAVLYYIWNVINKTIEMFYKAFHTLRELPMDQKTDIEEKIHHSGPSKEVATYRPADITLSLCDRVEQIIEKHFCWHLVKNRLLILAHQRSLKIRSYFRNLPVLLEVIARYMRGGKTCGWTSSIP